MFTPAEITYLKAQRLSRIATVDRADQPDVATVSIAFDGEYFYVSGRTMTRTLKYKNVLRGSEKVALVFDDHDPETRRPRGIKIHGTAEIVMREGHAGYKEYFRITPHRSWSWGIEQQTFVDGQPVFRRGVRAHSD
jgi:pyridoxamine 5'-phosphate oxidase family protein